MNHHHRISSFNPKWCFKPPPPTKDTAVAAATNTSICTSRDAKKDCRRLRHPIDSVPSSPVVSCMGQIKRESPFSSASATASSSSAAAAATLLSESTSSTSRGRRSRLLIKLTRTLLRRSSSPRASSRVGVDEHSGVSEAGISVVDMDPPLPVVRRGARAGNPVNLWERRRAGVGSEGLQLRQQQRLCLYAFGN